jgi:hypothetical protein
MLKGDENIFFTYSLPLLLKVLAREKKNIHEIEFFNSNLLHYKPFRLQVESFTKRMNNKIPNACIRDF